MGQDSPKIGSKQDTLFDALVAFVLRGNPLTTQAAVSQELKEFTAALANLKLGADRPASERHTKASTGTDNKDDGSSVVAAATTTSASSKSRKRKKAIAATPVVVLDSDSEPETRSRMLHGQTSTPRKLFIFHNVYLFIVF